MKDLQKNQSKSSTSVRESLKRVLESDGLSLHNCVEVPKNIDKLAQFRRIQDALDSFENEKSTKTKYYLIEIEDPSLSPLNGKKNAHTIPQDLSTLDRDLYHADGKLNHKLVLESADLLLQSQDYKNAEVLYRILRAERAFNEQTQIGLARCRAGVNDVDGAMRLYEEALLYQSTPELSLEYAQFLFDRGRHQSSAENLKRILTKKDLSPKMRLSMLNLASLAWEKADRPQEALKIYQDILVLDPKHSKSLCRIGQSFLKSKAYDEAEKWLRECLEIDPQNKEALNGLGAIAMIENKLDDGFDYYKQSLDIEISQSQAIAQFLKCAIQTKRYSEAIRLTEKYIENGPYAIGILYCLAGLYFHSQQYSAAEATCLNILNASPEHKETLALLKRIQEKHQVKA